MPDGGHIKFIAICVLAASVRLLTASPVKGISPLDQNEREIISDDFEMGRNDTPGIDMSDNYPSSTEQMDENMELTETRTDTTSAEHVVNVEAFWTEWFNSDSPAYGNGDLESPNFIADRLAISVCPKGTEIIDGDCRNAETHEGPPFLLDNLLQPCGVYGLMCLNKDQFGRNCTDFEVRFKCKAYDGSRRPDPSRPEKTRYSFDVRIYIVLAIVPVFIFIVRICWTFTWDRQNRRFIRRDSGMSRRQSEISFNAELSLPPPSYGELFGENCPSLSRNYKLCEPCYSSRCSLYSNINSNNSHQLIPTSIHSPVNSEVRALNGSVPVSDVIVFNGSSPVSDSNVLNGSSPVSDVIAFNGSVPISEVNVNGSAPVSDVIVFNGSVPISGSRSTENDSNDNSTRLNILNTAASEVYSVSGSISNENENGEQTTEHLTVPVQKHTSFIDGSETTSRDPNSTNMSVSITEPDDNRIVSNELTLRINTNDIVRESSDNSVSTEQDTASESQQFVTTEQCTCPCHKSNTREANYDNPTFVYDNETNNATSQRIPGMHVPIFVTWSTDESPPPTYKQALKILKKNKSVRC